MLGIQIGGEKNFKTKNFQVSVPLIPSQGIKELGKSHSRGRMQLYKIYRSREITVHTQIFRGEPYLTLILGKRDVLEQTKVQHTTGVQNE